MEDEVEVVEQHSPRPVVALDEARLAVFLQLRLDGFGGGLHLPHVPPRAQHEEGDAQGLDAAWLRDVQRHLPEPSAIFLLDIAPEEAVRRKAHGRDKFERDLPLLSRVRESYQRQAAAEGWEVVDGMRAKDEITEDILTRVRRGGLI